MNAIVLDARCFPNLLLPQDGSSIAGEKVPRHSAQVFCCCCHLLHCAGGCLRVVENQIAPQLPSVGKSIG